MTNEAENQARDPATPEIRDDPCWSIGQIENACADQMIGELEAGRTIAELEAGWPTASNINDLERELPSG